MDTGRKYPSWWTCIKRMTRARWQGRINWYVWRWEMYRNTVHRALWHLGFWVMCYDIEFDHMVYRRFEKTVELVGPSAGLPRIVRGLE